MADLSWMMPIEIALGALMLIGGFYKFFYTYHLGQAIQPATGALYIGLSVTSVITGALLLLTGFDVSLGAVP